MKTILETSKSPTGLYSIFLNRLNELKEDHKGETIPFADVFEKICRNFSIKKQQAWEVLFLLRDFGLIEIVKFRGIRVN